MKSITFLGRQLLLYQNLTLAMHLLTIISIAIPTCHIAFFYGFFHFLNRITLFSKQRFIFHQLIFQLTRQLCTVFEYIVDFLLTLFFGNINLFLHEFHEISYHLLLGIGYFWVLWLLIFAINIGIAIGINININICISHTCHERPF